MAPIGRKLPSFLLIAALPLVCLAFTLGGCSGEKPESPAGAAAEAPVSLRLGEPEGPTAGQGVTDVKTEGVISIEFLPVYPSAEEDLWAQIRGAAALSWKWKRNGFPIASVKGDRLSRMHFKKGDRISVFVKTPDGIYDQSVIIGNAPPRIGTVYLQNIERRGGAGIEARPEAFDADGDPVHFDFVWKRNGTEISEIRSAILPLEIIHAGDRVSLSVTPFDGEKSGKPFFAEPVVIPNAPPFFTSVPPSIDDFLYVYEIRCDDPDGDSVSYHLETCPSGMKLDSETGRLTWRIASDALGLQKVRIVAKDEKGAKAVQEFDLNLTQAKL